MFKGESCGLGEMSGGGVESPVMEQGVGTG